MASVRVARIRHRIQTIELNPATSSREVSVKILVNGTTVYELPSIEAGQRLYWNNLILICDVAFETNMSIKIVKRRRLKPDRVGWVQYLISDVLDEDEILLECDNPPFSVKLRFFGKEMAENSYANALVRAEEARKQEGTPGNVGKTARAFRALINFGEMIENLDPTGSTKVVTGICNDAWEHWEQQRRQNETLNELVEGLAAILPSINSVKQLADRDIRRAVTDMLFLIEDVAVFVVGYQLDGLKGRTVYSAFSSNAEHKAEQFITRFTTLKDEFDRSIALQTLQGLQALNETAKKLDVLQLQLLKDLNPVGHASYDPGRACMPDTRVGVINNLINWTQSNDPQRIYWIHGFAGLGKSSIAASVCQQLEAQGTLAGSFFCKRDDPDLRDPRRVLNTIVYGLATRCEPYGLEVAKAIQGDAQLCTYHIQRRYAGLVRRPLECLGELKIVGNLVVVIDALDECEVGEMRASLLTCLEGMSRLVPWLRLILTSRPEKDIKHAVEQANNHVISRNLYEQEVSRDMYAFVWKRMTDMATESGVAWPETEIKQLVQRSNGLFIWAATACKFIEEGLDAESRLKEILGDTPSTFSSHPLAALDELYEGAIWYSIANKREDNRLMVRRCLGAIVCTSRRTPLSLSCLKMILSGEVRPGVMDAVVKTLGSVLYEDGGPGGPVRLYHPSFEDYLVSRSERFRVDLAELDNMMATCCLKVMLQELRFNICGLETSYLLNRDVPDLQKRICGTIGMHLQYSCLHWSSHLNMSQRGLEETLRSFLFGETLMYWIEVLSLLNKLDVGLSSLLKVSSFTSTAFSDCSSCADDAYRFTLAFYDGISESAPHLYLSALAFAPVKSGIAQRLRSFFPNIPVVVSGGDEEWPPRLQTRQVSSAITALKLTSDCSRIISGHIDGSIQVRDVDTGALVLDPIETHTVAIVGIAVGCDDRLVAPIHEWGGVLRVWDIETGTEILLAKSHEHQSSVIFVEFSMSGDLIASGSQDGELKVWRVKTGEPVLNTRIECGEAYFSSILFCRCQLYVLSRLGSNITTHVWDGSSTETVLSPTQLPRGWNYLASSFAKDLCLVACEQTIPCQPVAASLAHNRSLMIWNLATGGEVIKLKPGPGDWLHPDLSVFSPDGRYFISTFPNSTIKVWDTHTGEIVGNLEHIEDYMLAERSNNRAPTITKDNLIAIAFSPRNHRIITASRHKNIINIWRTDQHIHPGQPRVTPEALPKLDPIALSPNSDQIFTNGFYFSDSSTGALIQKSSNTIPVNQVQSLAFSPGGYFVALGLVSAPVVVCDANSGAAVYELEGVKDSGFYGGRAVSFLGINLVCSYDNFDGSLCAWDLETQTMVLDLQDDPPGERRRISTSAEGQVLAFYTEHTVEIIGAENWTQISLLERRGAFLLLNFSPDGCKIVSASNTRSIQLWDVATGTQISELQHNYNIDFRAPIVCSHDDATLIAFGLLNEGDIQILDTTPDAPKYQPILGHSGRIAFVEFCRESRRIVSYSSKIRVYDVDACAQEAEPSSSTDSQSMFSSNSVVTRAQIHLLGRYLAAGLRSPTPPAQNSRLSTGSSCILGRLGG
ncbi:hypothetical protein FRC12_005860 [Ceratobasidium sp. 428]|nr:hypothetical protein FRC12_005860 [Ceratobasidium sp. 428]